MKIINALILLLFLNNCGSIRSLGIKTIAPILLNAGQAFQQESNWELFRIGLPGNIKLVDGLLSLQPENKELLVTAIKGYAGYAFTIYETLSLKERLSDDENKPYHNQAIATYTKALNYGLQFLKLNDITYRDLKLSTRKNNGIPQLLDEKINVTPINLDAIFYTAQALGSIISLNRSDFILIAEFPVAKGLFDWVCEKKPDFLNNSCQIFFATYQASRPYSLGGNPQKAKQIFEQLIEKSPHNWLVRTAFLEQYIIPMRDEILYEKQKKILNKLEKINQANQAWEPGSKENNIFANKSMRIFQSIAIKRFQIIKQYENDIF